MGFLHKFKNKSFGKGFSDYVVEKEETLNRRRDKYVGELLYDCKLDKNLSKVKSIKLTPGERKYREGYVVASFLSDDKFEYSSGSGSESVYYVNDSKAISSWYESISGLYGLGLKTKPGDARYDSDIINQIKKLSNK